MTTSRHISHPGNLEAVELLRAGLEAICGSAATPPYQDNGQTYFNVEAEIAGTTGELVVIGAHLDSTANNDQPYNPTKDAAPGADDDLSGVAGVLVVASLLKQLADQTPPKRTLRFVLFNAEEQLMVGSKYYATDLKEQEEDPKQPLVVAMIAMDMIGWHPAGQAPFAFEIHGAGCGPGEYKDAKDASDQLANVIAQAVSEVGANLIPQVYPLPGAPKDPATNRSDHSRFHYHDWAACLVSEDHFVDVATSMQQKSNGNPHYHRSSDLLDTLDFDYLRDIARTVAAAAWTIANP